MIFLDSLHGLSGESDEVALIISRLLKRVAVKLRSPVLMAGHVNKDGDLAGLEAIRHVIDGVHMMHVEGDKRVWEVEKNRDGRAFISSTYEMTGLGMVHVSDSTPDEARERLRDED
jgi:DNA repair protein RadA/Sms